MPDSRRQPGDDRPVGNDAAGQLMLINAIRAYKEESEKARRSRMYQNRANRQAYMGQQDWTHKNKGQSREFLPKTPVAVEQFVSFAKRALTQFGAYYEVVLSPDSRSPLSGALIRKLIDCYLNKLLVEDNVVSSFPILISDALKMGALESLIVLKVHGNLTPHRAYYAEPGRTELNEAGVLEEGEPELRYNEENYWRLRIDLVASEDYYPDPTGAGLYEIHSTERDLSYVIERAEEGVYDDAAVSRIEEDFRMAESLERRKPQELGQDEAEKPGFRKKVVIDEFWGTILDNMGNVVHKNCFCTIANNKYVVRPPVPNPLWHQESPFVAVPLIRVPFSVWHKAIFDHATKVNFALNELYNLILDGGIASVWGTRQLRQDELEDPSQVSDGIPQGETLLVKSTLPHGAKVLEKVGEGEVPRDAMAVFEMLSREFASASLSNELKLGSLPGGDTKATAIVELSQSQAVTIDGIVSDVERALIGKVIRKSWLTILQNMDDLMGQDVIDAVGLKGAFALSRMSRAERFTVFSGCCSFRVFGLSQMLARTRDFQKMMALLQAISKIPVLLLAFFKKYSPERVLSAMIKMLGINPEDMERDEKEIKRLDEELQMLPMFAGLAGGPGQATTQRGSGISQETTGEPQLPAEIASVGNPTAGLSGAGGS